MPVRYAEQNRLQAMDSPTSPKNAQQTEQQHLRTDNARHQSLRASTRDGPVDADEIHGIASFAGGPLTEVAAKGGADGAARVQN